MENNRASMRNTLEIGRPQLCAIFGFVFEMPWIPLPLYLQNVEWSGLPTGSLLPVALFFLCAMASIFFMQRRARQSLKNDDSNTPAAISVVAYVAGSCAFLGASCMQDGLLLFCTSMALAGLASGIAVAQWERCLLCLTRQQNTLAVLCYIACSCFASSAMATVPSFISLAASSVGITISAWIRPRLPYPKPAPAALDSKLLRLRAAAFGKRARLSMATIGCASVVPIVLFASSDSSFIGNSACISRMIGSWMPLAFILFAALIAAGWLPKREPDAFETFRATFIIAILSFFPLSPGTEFNMWLVLVFSMVWAVCIAGTITLVSCEINQEYAKFGEAPIGRNAASLCVGVLLGIVVLAAIKCLVPQFSGIMHRNGDGTMLVCSISMACVMLIFFATNVLTTREMLHETALFGQGKLAFHVPEEVVKTNSARTCTDDAPAHDGNSSKQATERKTSNAQPDFVSQCKNIALKYGLTPRELEVFIILSQGNTLARVQEELVISEGTAITHRRNIYRKLDVHSKQELIDFVRNADGKAELQENAS